MTTERIPVWLSDKKLWINDADRRTTCADVVTTLTGRSKDYAVAVGGPTTGGGCGSTMVADPGVRVLRIWQNLEPDQKLCLRRVDDGGGYYAEGGGCDDDAASEMSGYRGAQRKRRRDVVKYASRTVHPKRLNNTQAAEELLKLILEQSDTIRAQLKKLQDRDKKIERIETETHRTRADALGSNYLLDAYLGGSGGGGGGCGDDKEEKDSGIAEGAASVENDDDRDVAGGEVETSSSSSSSVTALEAIGYLERIVRINKKLYEHEERMIRLYVNVERCRDRDQLLDELGRVEAGLADAERAYRENETRIRDAETELRARLGFVEQLQYEVAIVDSENEYLMDFVEHEQQQSLPANRVENHRTADQQQQNCGNNHHNQLLHHHSHHSTASRVLDTLV